MAIGTMAAIALGAGAIGSAALGSSAAKKAGQQQYDASLAGVAEQRAAREDLARRLAPYEAVGAPALQQMMAAMGLSGPAAQAEYVKQQEESPIYQALARQGEEAMLQNAAATGGLRGGNLQGALAQYRPQLLNQFLERQYSNLGGLASLGQQSAAGVGSAGMQSASNIADLLAQGGAARAGATLGSARSWSQPFNLLSTLGGMSAQKSMGF